MPNALRTQLRSLAAVAEQHATMWMLTHEPDEAQLLEDIPTMVGVYTSSAGLLAADWYNSIETDTKYYAVPHEEIPPERLVNIASWVHAGPQMPENRMRDAAYQLVFDAARNTVWVNAQNEGVAVARHETATDCGECIAKASTAPMAKNSSSDDLDRVFHPHCEGLFIPVRAGLWEPPKYAREWHVRKTQAREAGNVRAEDIANWLTAH